MATIDVTQLGDYIREQRHAAQVSLRQLAKTAGVSNPYLSQVERGLKNPSAEILGQIAKALRISVETLYVRAGFLDERTGDAAVTESIAADTTLNERQKLVLLEVYGSFQKENAAANAAAEQAAAAMAQATAPDTETAPRPSPKVVPPKANSAKTPRSKTPQKKDTP